MSFKIKDIGNAIYRRLVLWNNPFYFYGIPNSDFEFRNQRIKLKRLNIESSLKEGESLIHGYPYALKIVDVLNGKFTIENGDIFLEFQKLRFQINSAEELFILFEVFIAEVYKYICLHDTIFIDIGMNSGISTLYYARDPMVKGVYSYELFRPTYLLGLQNLRLNETIAGKVRTFNYGLSNKEFDTVLDYSLSRKGRMGLKGLPDDEHFADARKESVSVKDVSSVLKEIVEATAKMDLVVKMDCEGEEYNLIEGLAKSGVLGKLTALIVEWHYVRPVAIEGHLKTFGFHIFSQVLPGLDSGMIYASKTQPVL